jgi:hypothetical protein
MLDASAELGQELHCFDSFLCFFLQKENGLIIYEVEVHEEEEEHHVFKGYMQFNIKVTLGASVIKDVAQNLL